MTHDAVDEARDPDASDPQGQESPDGQRGPSPRMSLQAQLTSSFEGLVFPFSRSPEEDEIREMYGWGV